MEWSVDLNSGVLLRSDQSRRPPWRMRAARDTGNENCFGLRLDTTEGLINERQDDRRHGRRSGHLMRE